MRQRSTTCCGVPIAAIHRSICLRSTSDTANGGAAPGMAHYGTTRVCMSTYLLDSTLVAPMGIRSGGAASVSAFSHSEAQIPSRQNDVAQIAALGAALT